MSKQETVKVIVKFPKAFIDSIHAQKWYKLYRGIEDFIEDAVRYRVLDLNKIFRHEKAGRQENE